MKRVAILGGAGSVGRRIASLLCESPEWRVRLAGRNVDRLRQAQSETGAEDWARADASDPESLAEAFCGADLVVVSASVLDAYPRAVSAALAQGADCMDILLSSPVKHQWLAKASKAIAASGRCVITDAGHHPGLPGVLMRHGLASRPDAESVKTAALLRPDWRSLNYGRETVVEFVREILAMKAVDWRNGRWTKADWRRLPAFDFAPPFGRQLCIPMWMKEVESLVENRPHLRTAGFYMAGFGPRIDYGAFPLVQILASLPREAGMGLAARIFQRSLQKNSKPPFLASIRLEVEGPEPLALEVSHEDASLSAAIAAAACIFQWRDSPRPGVHLQSEFVEPGRFLDDLRALGMTVGPRPGTSREAGSPASSPGTLPGR